MLLSQLQTSLNEYYRAYRMKKTSAVFFKFPHPLCLRLKNTCRSLLNANDPDGLKKEICHIIRAFTVILF